MSSLMKIVRPMNVLDATLASSSVVENDYAAWNSGTAYTVGQRCIRTSLHKVYECLIANTNNVPENNLTGATPKWAEVSATNRWKMFDTKSTSQTTASDSISIQLQASGRTDCLALLNVSAASVVVVCTDATDGVVYNKSFRMIASDGISDWHSYFFEPIERLTDLVLTDLPLYADMLISITLTDTGNTVKCGECVVGQGKDIGITELGASVGIVDYSVKTQDAWGDFNITERAFSKKCSFTIWVQNNIIDRLQALLASYRSTPVLYIGTSCYTSTTVFGFYKDFSIEIAYPEQSICSLEIEGLT